MIKIRKIRNGREASSPHNTKESHCQAFTEIKYARLNLTVCEKEHF